MAWAQARHKFLLPLLAKCELVHLWHRQLVLARGLLRVTVQVIQFTVGFFAEVDLRRTLFHAARVVVAGAGSGRSLLWSPLDTNGHTLRAHLFIFVVMAWTPLSVRNFLFSGFRLSKVNFSGRLWLQRRIGSWAKVVRWTC